MYDKSLKCEMNNNIIESYDAPLQGDTNISKVN